MFNDFKEASNFVHRYSQYCQKTGTNPQWSNVYNRVNVTLSNEEFGEISTKEVQIANYLDMLSEVKISSHFYINEHHSFDQIIDKSNIAIESPVNVQEQNTQMFLDQAHRHNRLE